MIPSSPSLDALADELADVLDREIALLARRLGQLEALSQAVLDHRNDALESLLGPMEQTHEAQTLVDTRLTALRRALAEAVGCPAATMTLGAVIARVEGTRRVALEYRRQQVLVLVGKVRREHWRAALVLSESARINRMILDRLLPSGPSLLTYDADGASAWRPEQGLVDAEF